MLGGNSVNMQMITDVGVIIGCFLMLFSVLVFNLILWKGYMIGRKLKEKTYQLGKDLTYEKVEDYIKFIDSIEIPLRKYYYDMIRAGHEIVKMNKEVDINLVEKLKVMILSKGVLVN